jgi:hypothetical protein
VRAVAIVLTTTTTAVSASSLWLGTASCRSPAGTHPSGATRGSPPKDELWLSDEELRRLQVTTEEVKLQNVDVTVVAVGPVVDSAECPVKSSPEERKSCVVVGVEQASLGRLRVGSAATARSSALVHDVLPGEVGWIAGALDSSGRTAKVACLFPDSMGELRPGNHMRVELVVGARPAFAVSRAAVMEIQGNAFVFSAAGTTDDGRHRFVRIPVRADGDTGGPWLPVADLEPGSFVVRSGTQALASMLTVTAL